ncbi:hypothetical protein [Mucilaginibacter sp. PAMB04168]|uniref:hypothetical protein n=1 Tax=Mucilaginibacter sp. PAMB04168 TaxID=3138567 RepID=UPI0031F60024
MTHALFTFRKLLFTALTIITYADISSAQAQMMPPATPSQLVLPANDFKTDFIWESNTLNNQLETHAALLIPVKLPNCLKQFYMQFDTGVPQSILYAEKISAIRAKYPASVAKEDSTQKLINQQITIAGKNMLAKEIGLKKYSGKTIDWKNKNSINVIGTIGTDFIENRTIVFDYPGKKIWLTSEIPNQLKSKLTLSKFMLVSNSILLPVEIQKKRVMLYFDTGSSAYELLTNKATALALATADAKPVQQQVKSWNSTLTANIYTTGDSITIASQKLPIKRVTYMDGVSNSQIDQMMKMGMGGMTGNKLFINHILVIDARNKQFGIITPSN